MKIVKFTKAVPPYNIGEIAGFDDSQALELVKAKSAIFHDATKKAEAPENDLTKKPEVMKQAAPVVKK